MCKTSWNEGIQSSGMKIIVESLDVWMLPLYVDERA